MSTAPQGQSTTPVNDPLVFDIETHREQEPKLSLMIDGELEKFKNSKGLKRLKPENQPAKIAERREELLDSAALSATTGRIVAIGYFNRVAGKKSIDGISEGAGVPTTPRLEVDLLIGFWSKVMTGRKLIGFNIKGFDLPFIVRRSVINGLDIPDGVFDGRYFSRQFVDLADYWKCGNSQDYESLDAICRAIGCGAKPDDVEGATFGAHFLAGGEARAKAIGYLMNDLDMTGAVADRFGV